MQSSVGIKVSGNVSIIQRFYDPDQQTYYDEQTDEVLDKSITEFQAKKVYISKLVVTNFSSKDSIMNLMYQIPQGSLPVNNYEVLFLQAVELKAFETQQFTF